MKILNDNETVADGKPNWVYNVCDLIVYQAWGNGNVETVIRRLKSLQGELRVPEQLDQLIGAIEYLEEGYDKLESAYKMAHKIPDCGSWPNVPTPSEDK